MAQLESINVEGELGVVFPDEVLSRLGVRTGGELVLAETPAGYLPTSAKLALTCGELEEPEFAAGLREHLAPGEA